MTRKYVFLNEVKNPTEELTGRYFSLRLWDISLTLNMTHLVWGIAAPTARNDNEETGSCATSEKTLLS